MIRAIQAAVVGAVGAAVLIPTAATAATTTPDASHHQIAYRDGGLSVYDVEAATTAVEYPSTANISGGAMLTDPALSPDATKLAYVTNYTDIHVLDLPTNTDTVLGYGELPQWTPDGTAVVFDRKSGPYGIVHQLYYMRAVAGATAVAIPNGTSAGYPHLSPDGKRVSFEDFSNVTPSGGDEFLGVMNVDGTDRRSLGVSGYPAAWSPDSSRLAYGERDPVAGGSFTRIAVINADGTGHTLLNSLPAGMSGDQPEDAVWATDGSKIYFSQDSTSSYDDVDIYSIAPNGTELTDVIAGPANASSPSDSGPETRIPAVPTYPSAPTATADSTTSINATWPAVTGATSYTVTVSPGSHTTTVTEPTASVTGLSAGTAYSVSVSATNDVGTGLPSAPTPVTTWSTTPSAPTNVTAQAQGSSAIVHWTAAVNGGSPLTGNTVTASPGGASVVTSGTATSATVPGLSDGGQYSFTVTATNSAGSSAPSAPSATITIDTSAPAASVNPLPVVTTTATSTVNYSASDAGTGVASYDVRYRAAGPAAAFGAYQSPAGFSNRTGSSASATIGVGTTICWSIRARDHAGNLSPWTPDHCTARAVDDRSLAAKTGGWTRVTSSAFFSGTATKAQTANAQVASAAWARGHVRLVVTECATCGSVRVYAGNTYLGTLSTHSTTTHYRVVLSLSKASSGGAIRIVTTSAAPVYIDAVGLLRY
ncbi:MAG: trimeric autotransporter adhesin [Frankiaceae bacterium]|nr:trimeric autotransporter adhesin [Frankiaceae bacterium]